MGASVARPALDRGRRVRTRWTEAVVHSDQLRRPPPCGRPAAAGLEKNRRTTGEAVTLAADLQSCGRPGRPGADGLPKNSFTSGGSAGPAHGRRSRRQPGIAWRRTAGGHGRPPAGTESNPATGPGAVSTGCPGAAPGVGRCGASVAGKSHADQLLCVTPLQENNRRPSEKAGCAVSPTGPKWRLLG